MSCRIAKTLALLGCGLAGSAFAADVTVYGLVDAGVHYLYEKENGVTTHSFKEASGQSAGSRFGFRGTEKISDTLTAGFVLENGFTVDDGNYAQKRLFGRQANVYLTGPFGTISFGRIGALSSLVGTYNTTNRFVPFGPAWGEHGMTKEDFLLWDHGRMDNTVTYVTPNFSGLTVHLQYSFEMNGQEEDKSTKNKRYAGIGAKYTRGPFETGFALDSVMNEATTAAAPSETQNTKDSLAFSWGASYDLGFTRVMGLYQYGKSENYIAGYDIKNLQKCPNEGLTGSAFLVGSETPLGGGTLLLQANYSVGHSEMDVDRWDIRRWGAGVAYHYFLSKMTTFYGYTAYTRADADTDVVVDESKVMKDLRTFELGCGIRMRF